MEVLSLSLFPVAPTLEHRASVKRFVSLQFLNPNGPSTLLVLVRRLVWILLVLVNLRPHYFSCSPG
jgi:hypothetical protein